MSLLSIQNLSYSYNFGDTVFSGVAFEVRPGDRIGLAGPNGCGKTTLLKLLSGELDPFSGTIIRRRGLRIASLAQVLPRESKQTLADFAGEVLAREEWEFHRVLEGLG